ncbi:MAG: N-acetylmuramoyl-L-alanine amidase [Candidimonas sp.]|nr:MAG: N-acetylmuramoyl-L-alanine amidase [Candidimonas sp.]
MLAACATNSVNRAAGHGKTVQEGNQTPGGPPALAIDHTIEAISQDSRVQFVVLHYTAADDEESLRLLSRSGVSSHYLITDGPRPRIYQLVSENRRAWHAGASQWYGRTYLNASSIGVEIVNAGREPDGTWAPYPPAQIEVVAALLKEIIARHHIKPADVVGHSDIAPQRKSDPGPAFPWERLAREGIGRWYDTNDAARYQREFERNGLPGAAWIQRQLTRAGYACPGTGVLDAATKKVIAAFQMHYRPQRHDGVPDARTLAILKAMP